MDAFLALPWRGLPAAVLVVAGLALLAVSVRRWRAAAAIPRDPGRALAYALGFRTGVLGLCAIAFGTGWVLGVGWVVVVSLIVLGEEMLEIGLMIAALRAASRQEAAARA